MAMSKTSNTYSRPNWEDSDFTILCETCLGDNHYIHMICSTEFPDPDDLLSFKLILYPEEGFYRGGRYSFSFNLGLNCPHEPPKVICETPGYHPNIDVEGSVCLNILREDWTPVLSFYSIIYDLQYLFLEPDPEDPLNKEAVEALQNNRGLRLMFKKQ